MAQVPVTGYMVRLKGDTDPRFTFYPGSVNEQLTPSTLYERRPAGPLTEFSTLASTVPLPNPVVLTGGSMTLDGDDLVIVNPTASGGNPTPSVSRVVMRGATNVTNLFVNGRYANAPLGTYVATWTAGSVTKEVTVDILADPQIVTASGVSLPTGGLFDTMTLGNLPGYAALANPASYVSTDPQGGVGTITFKVNGTTATANTVLKTDDVVEVTVAGTDGEIPLVHTLGTVQWTWTTSVDPATQTLTYADNPAAPGALALSVTATIDGEDYEWNATLNQIRTMPILAVGYPQLIQPDAETIAPGDTISVDVGPVLTDGGSNIVSRLTRDGETDPNLEVSEYQLSTGDYDQSIGFFVTLTDGRNPTSAATQTTVRMDSPVVVDGLQFVGVGQDVATASGPLTVPYPEGVADGDRSVLVLSAQGDITVPTITGWSQIGNAGGNSSTQRIVIYKPTTPGQTPPVQFTANVVVLAQIFAFRNVGDITTVAAPFAGAPAATMNIPGGAAESGSLVLSLLAMKSGSATNVPTGTNSSLADFSDVDDARTLLGGTAALTSWIGTVPEGTTTTTATAATVTTANRWAGVQLQITGAA